MSITRLILALCTVGMTTAMAQRTWVVDAARGQGHDFDEVQAAVNAASSGDTILVRRGRYSSTSVSGKALAILGEGRPTITGLTSMALVVSYVPVDGRVVIKGLEFSGGLFQRFNPVVGLYSSNGSIHIQDCTVKALDLSKSAPPASLAVRSCRAVTLTTSTFSPQVELDASTALITSCQLHGRDVRTNYPRNTLLWTSTPAMRVSSSTVVVSQSSVIGGIGAFLHPGSPAIECSGSDTVLSGDRTRVISGDSRPAIVARGGNLLYDPTVAVTHTGFQKSYSRRLPSLVGSGGQTGDAIRAELHARKGDLALLLAGAPRAPTILPGLGQLWLDLKQALLLQAFVVGTSEHRTITLPVPNVPSLRGQALGLQAIVGTVARVDLSTPAVVAID